MRKRIIPMTYVILVLLFLYIPMILVMIYSFNVAKSGVRWTGFTLDWYKEMVQDRNLMNSLWTSLEVALSTSVVATVIGTMGAVFVDKMTSKWKGVVLTLIYTPLVIPEIILAIALLSFFSMTPLTFGKLTLVLGHSTFCIPYVFIMVTIRLKSIDKAILEAAMDLGAKKSYMFATITLPLIAPSILSGVLLAFAMSLDDVVISSYVSGPKSMTLPMQIFSMLKLGVKPSVNALSTVMLVATFVVVAGGQIFAVRKEKKKIEVIAYPSISKECRF